MKVAMLAPYPRGRDAHGEESLGGVASYTKNLVDGLQGHARVKVLALHDTPTPAREADGVQVIETPRGASDVARALDDAARDPRIDVVHIQFEQHLYGGPLANLRLPLALERTRHAKPVVLTLHQVPDLERVDAAFLRENGFPPMAPAARAYLRMQLRRLARSVDLVIVHEPVLRERLVRQYAVSEDRVRVVPHGIEAPRDAMAPEKAREALGLEGKTVFLYFGFVSGYKGVDLLARAAERLPPDAGSRIRIVVAGKAPGRKLAKPAFREAHERLEADLSALAPLIVRKGFLSHEDVMRHVAAAHALVLPYREVFAASGPRSIALGLGTPVLASDAFRGMGVPEEAIFERDPDALKTALLRFADSEKTQEALRDDARRQGAEAAWHKVGRLTAECYAEAIRRREE